MDSIFRAYDLRGIYNDDLTGEVMLKVGFGLGEFIRSDMNGKSAVIGCDIRTSSEIMKNTLIAGLLSTGIKVYDAGMTSFGVTLFAGWKEKLDISGYITASHLTPEWNGLKLYYGDGVGFPEENFKKIHELCSTSPAKAVDWDQIQRINHIDYVQQYITFMLENFKPQRKLKVVLDCGNGSACYTAPEVFTGLGMELVKLYCDVDPCFPNRESEPTPESLTKLSETVVAEQADFGIAFDGDADRGVIVDNSGRVLSADPVGILLGIDILKEKKGIILANVESSMAVERVLEPAGGKVNRIRVGHTFLTLEAKKQDAILGIERSGHMIMPEYFLFDDAMVIPLRIAEILARSEKTLAELVDELPNYPKHTKNFDFPDTKKFQVIDNLKNKFAAEYDKVNTMDGVRVDLENGWCLIRASNTSPVIRLTVEADSDAELASLMSKFETELVAQFEAVGD
jgi:phosphoglucosamine mutase